MRNDNYFAQLMNPAMAWTDLGLRALDMTLASAQSMSDGFDRLTRVAADVRTQDAPAAAAPAPTPWTPPSSEESGLEAAARLQSNAFDFMLRSWEQWMSTMGTMLSLGAGRGISASLANQNPWLEAWRRSAAGFDMPEAGHRSAAGRASSRSSRNERSMEHAFATPESKPRRSRAKGKSKTSRTSR